MSVRLVGWIAQMCKYSLQIGGETTMARGKMTDEVKGFMQAVLCRETSVLELRLIPYVFDRLLNNEVIKRDKISRDENKLLNQWETEGRVVIESDLDGRRVFVTPKFYDTMTSILKVAYAADMLTEHPFGGHH